MRLGFLDRTYTTQERSLSWPWYARTSNEEARGNTYKHVSQGGRHSLSACLGRHILNVKILLITQMLSDLGIGVEVTPSQGGNSASGTKMLSCYYLTPLNTKSGPRRG